MADPTFEWVDIDLLSPNPYNPNAMDDDMFAKAIESIHKFGFVDPVTVREVRLTGFQIIDGEHRWKAAKDHSGACTKTEHVGLRQLPITNLGIVEDSVAKQLTIVLNETRGTYDPKKMGVLLTELIAVEPLPELLEVLPFDRAKVEELAELPHVDWNAVTPVTPVRGGERWVERVYRLPRDAAEIVDRAIRQVREDEGSSDAQALRAIAEHFLST